MVNDALVSGSCFAAIGPWACTAFVAAGVVGTVVLT
jgi:hypothetical protein